MTKQADIIERVKHVLGAYPGLELAIVYGSVAKGSFTKKSNKAVGFRNTAVHAYQAIDWVIVDKIINNHLDDFRNFAKEIYVKLG